MRDTDSMETVAKNDQITHEKTRGTSNTQHMASTDDEDTDNSKAKSFWQRCCGKQKPKPADQVVSIASLFRFASAREICYIILAAIASVVFGSSLPVSLIVFGDAIDAFADRAATLCRFDLRYLNEYCPPNITLTTTNFYVTAPLCNFTGTNFTMINYDLAGRTKRQTIMLIIVACCALVSGYARVFLLEVASERQIRTIRRVLFQSILNKDIAFFDKNKAGELSLYLTDDINKIHNGIGSKFGSVMEIVATFLSCITIGLVRGWQLALIILALAPIMFLIIIILFKVITKLTVEELNAYGKAGAVAEEAVSSIRTVFSYNGQSCEVKRYEKYLDIAKSCGVKKTLTGGITTGVTYFLLFCTYAIGFYYGTKLVWASHYTIGNVFTIFLCTCAGIFALGQASTYFQAFYEARVAAYIVWNIIDEPISINKEDDKGLTKEEIIGDIEFSNVQFSYPSRADVPILKNISFKIKHGQTTAIVGPSGSGKSTCVQLLQRFYDPQAGSILIDEKPIQDYNIKWLRENIGVVNQEPVLFHTTVRENILFGSESASSREVYAAAKKANAHDFIIKLPNKYETVVGERGGALSGGQKQRIAIARALLRDPKLLLLDEATSALDNESEKIVQEALDRATQGRTTLVIAHRLSTTRNADKIIVIDKGEIVEEGDHDSLIKAKGAYFELVKQQNLRQLEEEEDRTENDLHLEPSRVDRFSVADSTDDDFDKTEHQKFTIDSVTHSLISAIYRRKHSQSGYRPHQDEDEKKKMLKSEERSTTLAILKMNRPEWLLILIGCIAASINGAREPAYSIIQTKLATVFQECDKNIQQSQVLMCVLLYVGLAIISLVLHSLQGYMFALSGETLTKRLRLKAFQAILRQEIAFFDQEKNSSGAICTRLATDASAVKGASGVHFGLIFQHMFGMLVGIVLGLGFAWQLTCIMFPFLPFIFFGGLFQIRLAAKFARTDKQILENAGKIAIEAIQNIRTVVQLSKEGHFYDRYYQILETIHLSTLRRSHLLGILFAISNAAIYFAAAAFISFGTYLVDQNITPAAHILLVLNAVIFAARTIGQELTLFPDYGKALEAAENIFEILDRQPTIDNESKTGRDMINYNGKIDFDDVYFSYPGRPESIILKNLKLNIKPGQSVALVGRSGCGKSTIIQLIERFYDVNVGRLLIDGTDVRSLNIQWYRSQIGIVSQEPILFNISIRDNIAYGDNTRTEIPLDEIIQAAKSANIHEFIEKLPHGYDTNCGAKGSQLSGGQKQRIAIARALIRNPKVLLLDEATSALDSENEKTVQESLNRAVENRTSITIAHRLSTIQNADVICVLHNGAVVETGTHEELLALGGRYYRLATKEFQ